MQKVSSTHLKQNKKDRRQVPSTTANSLENKASSSFQESQTPVRVMKSSTEGLYALVVNGILVAHISSKDNAIYLRQGIVDLEFTSSVLFEFRIRKELSA